MLDPMLCPPELSHSATFKQPSWILNTATENVGPLQQRPCREPSEAVAHRVLMSKATGCTRRAVSQTRALNNKDCKTQPLWPAADRLQGVYIGHPVLPCATLACR